jgi:pantoate--beta-alanine ligase
MKLLGTVAAMHAEREHMTGSIGLVPTMGYLHEGHLSLVRRALADSDHVVVSIFVNPTQFGPNEDLARYPRNPNRDLKLLQSVSPPLPRFVRGGRGVRDPCLAFVPSVEEMYPPGFEDWVEVQGPLTERLEGAHRPGHFRGVTTVVARLLRIVAPHRAYFGQKDAQQLRVIRQMVREQDLRVEIVPMPTIRESDGLALSSRNIYLSPAERKAALAIPRALALARRLVIEQGVTDAGAIRSAVRDDDPRVDASRWDAKAPRLDGAPAPLPVRPEAHEGRAEHPHLELDYVSVSDEQTLVELQTIDRPALILLAARVGTTRLIDNTIVVPKDGPIPDQLRPLVEADAASLPRSDI